MFSFSCDGIVSFGCIRISLRGLAPLKMTCILVCQKILLNSSFRLNIGNRNEDIFLDFNPVSGFMIGVAHVISDSLIITYG